MCNKLHFRERKHKVIVPVTKIIKENIGNQECSKGDADFITMVPGKTMLNSFQEEECSWRKT